MESTSEIVDKYIKWMKIILVITFVFSYSLYYQIRGIMDALEKLWAIFSFLASIATVKLPIHHWINQVRRGNVNSQTDEEYYGRMRDDDEIL